MTKDFGNKTKSYAKSKYAYVVHAEANAILNATTSLKNGTLYVTLFPCNECMKLLVQAGVKEIIYMSDKDKGKESHIASMTMMEKSRHYSKTNSIGDNYT